ncbi:hypothetical protein J6590_052950 [Homalodisca vitripennis]|nr:hypothetical protein J6590_052950 [Homalodisca vitripennis]
MSVHPSSTRVKYPTPYSAITAEGSSNHCCRRKDKYNRLTIFTTMSVHPSSTRLRVTETTTEGGRSMYNRLTIFTTMSIHPSSTRVKYPTPYSAITAEGSSNHCCRRKDKYNRLTIFTTMSIHPSSTRVKYPTPYSAITAEGSSNHC